MSSGKACKYTESFSPTCLVIPQSFWLQSPWDGSCQSTLLPHHLLSLCLTCSRPLSLDSISVHMVNHNRNEKLSLQLVLRFLAAESGNAEISTIKLLSMNNTVRLSFEKDHCTVLYTGIINETRRFPSSFPWKRRAHRSGMYSQINLFGSKPRT